MKKVIILLVFAFFLLASCSGNNSNVPDKTTAFIGGNVGLQVGLVKGMPPAAIYDDGKMTFGVGVALQNVGESDAASPENPFLRVSLEGIRAGAFSTTPADLVQDVTDVIVGSHKQFDGTIIPGMIRRVIFEPLSYKEQLQGNIVQNFIVNTCYDYETVATVPLCFKNDVIENAEDASICTLTGQKLPQNSGAPIHVTSLVENPLAPYKVMGSMIIEHVGTGDFYGRSDDEDCDPSVTNMNKYKVHVEVTSEDPDLAITCSSFGGTNEGMLTLYAGAPATLTCTFTGSNMNTRVYSEPITVKLKYRYGDSVMQSVVVQALGRVAGG